MRWDQSTVREAAKIIEEEVYFDPMVKQSRALDLALKILQAASTAQERADQTWAAIVLEQDQSDGGSLPQFYGSNEGLTKIPLKTGWAFDYEAARVMSRLAQTTYPNSTFTMRRLCVEIKPFLPEVLIALHQRAAEEIRKRAIAKLTPEEREALGVGQ